MSCVMVTEVTCRALLQIEDQLVDLIGEDRIQARRRLIVEHDLGAQGDGARQPGALLHATGDPPATSPARPESPTMVSTSSTRST